MNFGHIKNIHFVGIGGIGMSGIAEILTHYDLRITGCDSRRSSVTDRLSRAGIDVKIGHSADHVHAADLLVASSAVPLDHPELQEARAKKVPVIRRAEMLGEITRLKRGIAVAGTHGKTTTSAMIATVLGEAGLDPTLIIGGVLRNLDQSAKLGRGEFLVVEADEYDRSFLTLHPSCAVITNIEADHLDYYKDLDDIKTTFEQFARLVPFYGVVIGCVDDANVLVLLARLSKRTVGYGLSAEAEVRAVNLRYDGPDTTFDVVRDGKPLGAVTLRVPGEHNVRNALAAVAVALELGMSIETAASGLSRFRGVERRFQIIGEYKGAIIVDDYAHHPTEVKATLSAARSAYPDRRLVALFQPHLFSRTRDFFDQFAESLEGADIAFVTPIYPAREEPIAGVTADLITQAAIRRGAAGVSLLDMEAAGMVAVIRSMLRPNDIFVTMGAGDVHKVGEAVVEADA